MLLGALRQELPCRVPVKRPEELLVTRQHEILVVLPTTLLWWHSEARLRGGVGCQEGADQALGWEERHPEGPEGHSELAHPAGTAPRTAEVCLPRTTLSTPRPARFTSPSCSHCLFLTRFSRGTDPVFSCSLLASSSPPTLTPSCPHTQSPCPICTASARTLPARLSLLTGFCAGFCSPFGFSRLEPPRVGTAALLLGGARRAAAPPRDSASPALRAVIGRDSVCRCRPMMERGGSGGPAPLGSRDEAQTVSERA